MPNFISVAKTYLKTINDENQSNFPDANKNPTNTLNASSGKIYHQNTCRQKPNKKELAVFGLPSIATKLLTKAIEKQLRAYVNRPHATFPISLEQYLKTTEEITRSGYIAISTINTDANISKLYYKSAQLISDITLPPKKKLSGSDIYILSHNIPQIINLGLVAFNLSAYPPCFCQFKTHIKTLEYSLNMFKKSPPEIKEAKLLFKKLFF